MKLYDILDRELKTGDVIIYTGVTAQAGIYILKSYRYDSGSLSINVGTLLPADSAGLLVEGGEPLSVLLGCYDNKLTLCGYLNCSRFDDYLEYRSLTEDYRKFVSDKDKLQRL